MAMSCIPSFKAEFLIRVGFGGLPGFPITVTPGLHLLPFLLIAVFAWVRDLSWYLDAGDIVPILAALPLSVEDACSGPPSSRRLLKSSATASGFLL